MGDTERELHYDARQLEEVGRAVARIEAAERELVEAIKAAGVGSIWDRRISFVVLLLIGIRLAMKKRSGERPA